MTRALLVALALLAPAAPAEASYVGVWDGNLVIHDVDDEAANAVHVRTTADGRYEVVDAAGLDAFDQCEQVDAFTARCVAPQRISVLFREGPDLFQADDAVTAPIDLRGGDGADRARGGSGADRLDGEAGNDQIDGGGGDDELVGAAGDDLLLGGEGMDGVDGGSGFDDIDPGTGRDQVNGGPDRDRVRYQGRTTGVRVVLEGFKTVPDGEDGLREVEVLEGTPFDDVIQGSPGDDEIDAGEGNDRVAGGGGIDLLVGGGGHDVLFGDSDDVDAPTELPTTWGGRDDLRGGPGDDTLRGDGGRDRLAGDEGNDVLDAREGTSTQEVLDEEPGCGAGEDRAVLDWNDEPADCETLEVRPRPPYPRPPRSGPGAPAIPGPGPQPVLGVPVVEGGSVRVPVFCTGSSACVARVTVRAVRRVRIQGRLRSRAGRAIAGRRATVAAGSIGDVTVRLPRRARRGRVIVELRIGSRRYQRPLSLGF